ncbi:MAG TPA: prepilin-type N-terminal cleavage/methylation domain-containing protein [Verrucomicrobiae bacterium]|nr:prepilin-type N-terminal cleavage/methylation domain-containing protein [Verrucomicrobiae bacterium]
MHSDRYKTNAAKTQGGFTLVEVVIAIAIVATAFAGTILCYTQLARRAQWSGYSLAAQALAIQQIEQARSATYDPAQNATGANPDGRNEITNMVLIARARSGETVTGYTTNILDIPYSGNNFVFATNYVTLKPIPVGTGTGLRVWMVKVDTVWPFSWANQIRLFTNSISTYCAPDNRSGDTLFN